MSDRPTPISDGRSMSQNDVQRDDLERDYVPLDVSRRLEQMCGELADRLESTHAFAESNVWHDANVKGFEMNRQALAKWDAMKKECGG